MLAPRKTKGTQQISVRHVYYTATSACLLSGTRQAGDFDRQLAVHGAAVGLIRQCS